MFRSLKLRKKLVAFWSLFSLLLNMAQPAIFALAIVPPVFADELPAPSESPSPEPTIVPSEEPSPEPTLTPEPSVEPTIAPEPSPGASVEPTPSLEPSPEPSTGATPAPSTNPSNPEPAEDSSPAPPSEAVASSEASPSPSPSTLLDLNESLTLVIIDNTQASSVDEFDFAVTESGSATLATDKPDYAPTDMALITGSGFLASTTYSLTISSTDEPATSTTTSVTTDTQGNLFYAYQLDGIYRPNYKVEALLGSMLVATVTFTDAKPVASSNPSASLEQCRNGASGAPNNCENLGGGVGWVNGNAGSSNSHYVEGLSIPYRTIMQDLPVGTPITITLEYDIKHSGAHAIDFLTHYNRLEPHAPFGHLAETINPTSGVAGVSATVSTFAIPAPSSGGSPVAGQPTTRFNSLPANEKLMTLFGGTITGMSYVAQGDLNGSNTSSSVNVTFTVDSPTAVLAWGGHIAREIDWGTNMSAGGISGSPYHMRLIDWNLSNLGNQDRSLSADAVAPPSSITVIKDAEPNHIQDFTFTTTGNGLSNFSLDDDADQTVPNTTTFNSLLEGTFTVVENATPGWSLESVVCVTDGTSNTTSTFTPITNGASINLVAGENVTCTFTNEQVTGSITIVKDALPNSPQDFAFTGDLGSFNLDDDADATLTHSQTFTGLVGGTYAVSETPVAGWDLTSASCTDGSLVSGISLDSGENVTCTFTNTARGQIIVAKETLPDGDAALFDFTASYDNDGFVLSDGQTNGSGYLVAGTYSVAETLKNGWSLTDTSCSDQSAIDSISLQAGETVTCTFENTKLGSISGFKYNDLNGDGDWDVGEPGASGWLISLLDESDNVLGTQTTDGSGFYNFDNLLPATYSLIENLLAGWTQTGAPAAVELSAGEVSENNNFFNFADATIIVHKNVVLPDGTSEVVDTTSFTARINGSDPKTIAEGTNATYSGLQPGAYTVTEDVPPTGYSLVSITDDDATTPAGQVAVTSGATNHVYITNRQLPANLIVVKNVINDNGGHATQDDFSVTINTNPAVWGSNEVIAGSYTVAETTLPGYTPSTWGGDCNDQGGVTVLPGETKTCEITNDDQQAYITVIKVVTNNNGGNAEPNDFALKLEENAVLSGIATAVNPGTYTAHETLVSGYSFTGFSGDCNENGETTVALGESKSCTLTNDDIQPTITLNKVVTGGSAGINDFGLSVGQFSVESGVVQGVNANTPYALNEAGLEGYSFTSLSGDTGCPTKLGDTVTLSEGGSITCTITNTRDTGTLIVRKLIDADGNLETTEDQFDGNGWLVDVDGNGEDTSNPSGQSTVDGSATFSPLNTGSYNVSETMQDGYALLDAYCNEESGSLDGLTIYSVDLESDQVLTCTFVNMPVGTLHGYKWHDKNASHTEDELGEQLSGWTINLYKDDGETYTFLDSMITNDAEHYGWYWFEHLFPGNYKICEVNQAGWLETYPTDNDGCHLVSLPDGNSGAFPELQNAVGGPAYNFGNVALSRLVVTKYSDDNGNGSKDEGESVLAGWTMNLSQEGTDSEVTNENGQAIFEELIPGQYVLSEDQQEWYTLTNISCTTGRQINLDLIDVLPELDNDNEHGLTLYPGLTTTCEVGNQPVPPVLTIQKSNNALGVKSPGDTVLFTLIVRLTGSPLYDVQVVDLPASGFVYQAGSWTSDKPGVSEPTYTSPGTWSLGTMMPGDEVTLTYLTKISADQDPGDYKDLAMAFGCEKPSKEGCNSTDEGALLAQGINSPYLDGSFVGTNVVVDKDQRATGSVEIQGEVLGAATQLPQTGPSTTWLMLALAALVAGLSLILGGRKMTKALTIIALTVAMSYVGSSLSPVMAVDDLALSVRLEQPKSPTRLNSWDLVFTVLDLENRSAIVKCYKKTPSTGFVEFSSQVLAAGGNSSKCAVDGSTVSVQGEYEFYVTADAGAGVEESAHVKVTYDSDGPSQPTSYTKEHPWGCRYVIKFHTASDSGATSWVEIYSSDQTNFTTDASTRVGSVGIGSDQDGEFIHDRADGCDRPWYYVIRAFDAAGNQSAHRGDEVVTLSSTPAASPTTAALVVTTGSGSILGEKDDVSANTDEEVAAGEGSPAPATVEGSGLVAGMTDAVKEATSGSGKWWILGLVVVLGLAYALRRRRA